MLIYLLVKFMLYTGSLLGVILFYYPHILNESVNGKKEFVNIENPIILSDYSTSLLDIIDDLTLSIEKEIELENQLNNIDNSHLIIEESPTTEDIIESVIENNLNQEGSLDNNVIINDNVLIESDLYQEPAINNAVVDGNVAIENNISTINPISLNIKIDGISYDISLDDISIDAIQRKSIDFCLLNKIQLKINDVKLLEDCVMPLSRYLHSETIQLRPSTVADPADTRILKIGVPVDNGKDKELFYVSFDPFISSPNDAATYLCNEKANVFNLNENNFFSTCVNPITEFLTGEIRKIYNSETVFSNPVTTKL